MTGPAPAPPQGPGVYPPFPAPPVEGKGRRTGLGLAIGGGVALLVCGGGVAATIGLGIFGTRAVTEQVGVVVGDYFEALEQRRYDDAYGMLCPAEKARQTQSQFRAEAASATPIRSHRIGDLGNSGLQISVPVTVTYTDGRTGTLQVELAQDSSTGDLEVCGVGE